MNISSTSPAPDPHIISHVPFWCRLLVLDAKLYAVLACYCEKVLPGGFGPRQHWAFVLRPSYWCLSHSGSPPSSATVDPAVSVPFLGN